MELTTHQKEILKKGLEILETSNRLVIKGSAGVGKTFLVKQLILSLIHKNRYRFRYIICSAPTNKAVRVVKEKVGNTGNIKFNTIHSCLKLKRRVDNDTGIISFEPHVQESKPPLYNIGLLIIDEASMINSQILSYIEEYATINNTMVIFLGDSKQINPVGEENSIVFEKNYPTLELTEIIRQSEGNPIIKLSLDLNVIYKKKNNINKNNMGYLYDNDIKNIIKKLSEVNGTNILKYLAYTNKEVDNINNLVRLKLYKNPKKIELNEVLIFDKGYNNEYNTNDELKVNKVEVVNKNFTFVNNVNGDKKQSNTKNSHIGTVKFKVYVIYDNKEYIDTNLSVNMKTNKILVIHEDDEKRYIKFLGVLKGKIRKRELAWGDYYKFVENFANMKYNHAISVHKSQGSTYKNVVLNVKNIRRNPSKVERDRLMYTAVTRAERLVIFYNS